MDKKQVIQTLEEIARYLEIKGENTFKISAYRKAAQALEKDERSLQEIDRPQQLAGIGKATSEVILELKETGQSTVLSELQESLPASLMELIQIPGLGGKKVGRLYRELGIESKEGLLEAAKLNTIQALEGFGAKSEEKMIQAIESWSERPDRLPLATVLPIAKKVESQLNEWAEVIRFSRAGSLRRLNETVKDLDYIIATDQPAVVKQRLLDLQDRTDIISKGDTKVSLNIKGNPHSVSVDFRIVADEAFATALHHFTGSKDHNVRMRQLAKQQGEKINEYGVEVLETGEILTFPNETDFFHHFHTAFIPPEAREDGTEIDAHPIGQQFVPYKVMSDLHMHTTWSDGAQSFEEMAEAAKEKGYHHIAITDHSHYLKVANGLTVERLKAQHQAIRDWNERHTDFSIFTGIEMDILPNGSLDYEDDVLASIDFVIASIHSSFSQSKADMMKRMKQAMFNPHVDMIAHPTGRLIGKRAGYQVDVEQLIQWSKETGTVLELNANPNRLDLELMWLKRAVEVGAPLAINSDAHRIDMLEDVVYGYGQATKAKVPHDTIINTWSTEKLTAWLNTNKQDRRLY
ncbi:DNA polymerase/3'-5' exonuclease PolX [Shouchella hunanensis]|uniref:DNA polymerase/3'-5' exonuclease PolX n=1 Tax=Shouchella hunanensis TaxID=766894 RepID=A0ABY7W645_9BACI|nr:DNA polymerase/3'-5' exonuclease PolX [Shouchella hunanensis]WDF04158.1 DNA polymerase/3'-5' exonuclease PolX [Shouchella hunanensis]